MPLPDGLLEDVKNSLNITWSDAETDKKIRGIVEQGIFYLNDKLGEEAEYSEFGYPRMLLMEYSRYARDEALEVFESNYQHLLLAMQNKKAVKSFAKVTDEAEQ